MIPNVCGSVTDYANKKCVYAGRCLGPINRPWLVPGLKHGEFDMNCILHLYYKYSVLHSVCRYLWCCIQGAPQEDEPDSGPEEDSARE